MMRVIHDQTVFIASVKLHAYAVACKQCAMASGKYTFSKFERKSNSTAYTAVWIQSFCSLAKTYEYNILS